MSGEKADASASRAAWLEPVALVLAKCALSYLVLRGGFAQISDDDYSRTVIAEQFAHAPRLDPSGTSWLPFPFWVYGTSMLAFGRSLAVARATAFVLGVCATLLFWWALRARHVAGAAVIAFAAFALPWMAWLSVATVPEALTAGLASAGILGLSAREPLARRDLVFAACILAACLCRYEAWAVALAAVPIVARRAWNTKQRELGAAVVALLALGPFGWLAWNAHAHGDALHFLLRVARFRQRSGQAGGSLLTQLWFYPGVVLGDQKEIAALVVLAVLGVALRKDVRDAFARPLGACLTVLLFLVYGALNDGAPTHHPARALCIVYPLLVAAAFTSVRAWTTARVSLRASWAASLAFVFAIVALPWPGAERPGSSAAEDRAPEIARGLSLRASGKRPLVLTPCAYEHLALIAAYGAPEDVTIEPPQAHAEGIVCNVLVTEHRSP